LFRLLGIWNADYTSGGNDLSLNFGGRIVGLDDHACAAAIETAALPLHRLARGVRFSRLPPEMSKKISFFLLTENAAPLIYSCCVFVKFVFEPVGPQ
jgi:hypothetical protein